MSPGEGSGGSGGSERLAFTAALAWVELEGRPQLLRDACVIIERGSGRVLELRERLPEDPSLLVHDLGHSLLLPGFVNAHSHAFQRAIRGATHQRGAGDPSSFWSWREAMYAAATALDPDQVFAVTRACFAEMLGQGITCVGEFHYLHHQPDGRPYADPNELSRQVIRAAQEVGVRLALLEVFYARAGARQPGPLPEQRRFCDASTEAYLARLDALRELAGSAADPGATLTLGVAPHSVRAVPAPALAELAAYANRHQLPIHAHVSEQPRENLECREEHGRTPLQVFAEAGCLDRPGAFTAVHAIHVEAEELPLLRAHQVCACPTTEADLGDGIVPASDWHEVGATLALGSDSNAVIDLIAEARLLEMHERLRLQGRLCLRDGQGRVAPVLVEAATRGGARALGRPALGRLGPGSPFDAVVVALDHPSLREVGLDHALDALWLAGSGAPISQVWVGGRRRI